MTLSLFPSLLFLDQLAPLLIRVTLGAVAIYWAYRSLRKISAPSQVKAIGLIEGVSGILLVIGLWTQAAALVLVIDLLVRLAGKIRDRAFFTEGVNYYFLLLIMALSLLVTGAGVFAFDLPL